MRYNRDWRTLYKVGGSAALLAGLFFRRNMGAEISLFTGFEAVPQAAADWYALLLHNPFLGLSFLAIFDLVNYLLVVLIFLALVVALWPFNKNISLLAITAGFVGINTIITSNISLSMLSLSKQYALVTGEMERAAILAAGQALLAMPLSNYPGTGAYIGLLLVALAGLLFSLMMLQSCLFSRVTAITGIVASSCDLTYCFTFTFLPYMQMYLLAAAGLFWMIWHLLIARRLFQLYRQVI